MTIFIGGIIFLAIEFSLFVWAFRKLDKLAKKITYSIEEYLINFLKSEGFVVEFPDYLINDLDTFNHDD